VIPESLVSLSESAFDPQVTIIRWWSGSPQSNAAGLRPSWLNWLARERSSGQPVGHFQATISQRCDLGYVSSAAHRGKGYAGEGLAGIITATPGMRFGASIDRKNHASIRVVEKLGFEQVRMVPSPVAESPLGHEGAQEDLDYAKE
jgi:RimJ/RimL family protein N-acetyltransferase